MGNQLGVTVNGLSDQLQEYFGAKNGVLVSSVTEDSAAAKAGVKAGDVITAVNGKAVQDAQDLRRELSDIEDGKPVTLSITRDKKPLSLTATIDAPDALRPRVKRIV